MRRIRTRVRRPSAPLVISMIALFVALTGTGIAANVVPLAKRALTADKAKVATTANLAKNALKLNGRTAAQIAATPGPADTLNGQTAAQIIAAAAAQGGSLASRITVHSVGWHLDSNSQADWYANCDAGEKVIAGGWDQAQFQGNGADFIYNRPKPDGSGWWVKVTPASDASAPIGGSMWAVCIK